MADPEAPDAGQPIKPTWKQIGLLLLSGLVLVPGLCFTVASVSTISGGTVMDQAGTVVVTLLVASILLTLVGAVLAFVRIVKALVRR